MARTAFASTGRDLRLLAGSAFLSAAGDLLALLTLALVVHELTGSGIAVSGYFVATMMPTVLVAALAGSIADRFEPVRVMLVASLAQAAIAVALALSTGNYAAIVVLTALLWTGSAVSQPAEFALVPHLTRSEDLTRANGVMEAARYAGFAAGPVLVGVVALVGGAELALLVNAASFLAIAAAATLIRTRRGPSDAGAPTDPAPPLDPAPLEAASDRARDGIAVLWRDPILRPALLAAVGALLLISASLSIEVFYVQDVLHAGPTGYAATALAWMVGMVVGATRIAPRVPLEGLAAAALIGLGVQGAGMAGQTIWTILPFAIAGYAIGGVGHGAKNTLLRTLIQRRVPDRLHGRAFAAYNAARNTAEIAALAGGGLLVAALGPRTALAVAGLGPVLAAVAGLVALRRSGSHRAVRVTLAVPAPPSRGDRSAAATAPRAAAPTTTSRAVLTAPEALPEAH